MDIIWNIPSDKILSKTERYFSTGDLLSGDLDFDGHQKIESRQQSLQELDKVSYYNILIQSSFWKNCNVTVNFKS